MSAEFELELPINSLFEIQSDFQTYQKIDSIGNRSTEIPVYIAYPSTSTIL